MKFAVALDKDQSMKRSCFTEVMDIRLQSPDLFAAQHVLTNDHGLIKGGKVMIYVGLDVSLSDMCGGRDRKVSGRE
ncbi:hypothetical protein [Bradyrhizobium sp. 141]|uniref:hypothetical protein n=1 Tax=Bradyrhizobium sp. 141 TaxID=2782617 RepID=UPI001FF88C6A|nr:hypothetical protein [Bradyrhizobium sp. 141]MCK1718242.1 hypothetical protein [Bradyrhizobium sp. 141]